MSKPRSQKRSNPRRRTATSIEALLRRKRRRSAWRIVAVLLSLIVLVLLDRGGMLLAGRGDMGRYDGRTFLVTRVIDGDTFDIAAPDLWLAERDGLAVPPPVTRVRLWGIDTPETAKDSDPRFPDRPARPAEPFADDAAALTTQLLAGQTVTLLLERTRPRGTYGRLVAHAQLQGAGQLAERLLLAGLTRADDRWPHRYAERYALLEQQARRDLVGLWSIPRDPYAPSIPPLSWEQTPDELSQP